VEETIVRTSNRVITNQAVSSANTEIIDHILERIPERLVRHAPRQTYGREEAKAIRLVEALRAVETEVELGVIAAVVRISKATGHTQVTERQRQLKVSGISRKLVAHNIDQHPTKRMHVIKCAVVVQRSFHIED